MRLKTLFLGLCAGTLTACSDFQIPDIGRADKRADDQMIVVLGQELKGDNISETLVKNIRNTEGRNIDHGASGLVIRAALEGQLDGETNIDKFLDQPGDSRCTVAKELKAKFHQNGKNGALPLSFGKIIKVELDQFDDPYWAGYIDLCTWIKNGDS